jgi:hypothetical protein
MKSGKEVPGGKFEKEKRMMAARLHSTPRDPPRMAKIAATMMELEERGMADMRNFITGEQTSGKEIDGITVLTFRFLFA